MLKKAISTSKANPIGFLAGAGLSYYALGKYSLTSNIYIKIVATIIGGYVGAYAQSSLLAKKGAMKSVTAAQGVPQSKN